MIEQKFTQVQGRGFQPELIGGGTIESTEAPKFTDKDLEGLIKMASTTYASLRNNAYKQGIIDEMSGTLDDNKFFFKDAYINGAKYVDVASNLGKTALDIDTTYKQALSEGKSYEEATDLVNERLQGVYSNINSIRETDQQAADSLLQTVLGYKAQGIKSMAELSLANTNNNIVNGDFMHLATYINEITNRDNFNLEANVESWDAMKDTITSHAIQLGKTPQEYLSAMYGQVLGTVIDQTNLNDGLAIDKLNGITNNLDKLVENGILSPAMSTKLSLALFEKAEKKRALNVSTIMAQIKDPMYVPTEHNLAVGLQILVDNNATPEQIQTFKNLHTKELIANAKLTHSDWNSTPIGVFQANKSAFTKAWKQRIGNSDSTPMEKAKLFIQVGSKYGDKGLIGAGLNSYAPPVKALFMKGADLGGTDVNKIVDVLQLINTPNAVIQSEVYKALGAKETSFLKTYGPDIINCLQTKGDIVKVLSGVREAFNNTTEKPILKDGKVTASLDKNSFFSFSERSWFAGQSSEIQDALVALMNTDTFSRSSYASIYKGTGANVWDSESTRNLMVANNQYIESADTSLVSSVNIEKVLGFREGYYNGDDLVSALNKSVEIKTSNGATFEVAGKNKFYEYNPDSQMFYINYKTNNGAITKEGIPVNKVLRNYASLVQTKRNEETTQRITAPVVTLAPSTMYEDTANILSDSTMYDTTDAPVDTLKRPTVFDESEQNYRDIEARMKSPSIIDQLGAVFKQKTVLETVSSKEYADAKVAGLEVNKSNQKALDTPDVISSGIYKDDLKYQFTKDTGMHSFVSNGVLHTMPDNVYQAYIDFVKDRVETPLVKFNGYGDGVSCLASLDEDTRNAISQDDDILQELYMGSTANTVGQYVNEFMEYYNLNTNQTVDAYKENGKKIMEVKHSERKKELSIDSTDADGGVSIGGDTMPLQGRHTLDHAGNPVVTSYTKEPFTITRAWLDGVFGNKGIAFAEFLHENESFITTAKATDPRFTKAEVVGLGVIFGTNGYPKYQKQLQESLGDPRKMSEVMGIIQQDYFKTLPTQTKKWLGMDYKVLRGHPDLNNAFFAAADATWHGGPYCGNYFMALRKVKEEGLDSAMTYLKMTKTYYQAGPKTSRRAYQEEGLKEFARYLETNSIELPRLDTERAKRWGDATTYSIYMEDYNAGKIKG